MGCGRSRGTPNDADPCEPPLVSCAENGAEESPAAPAPKLFLIIDEGRTAEELRGDMRQGSREQLSLAAAASASALLCPGSVHKKWTIGRHLGEGAFGVVKKCVSKETSEACAVKIIPRSINQSAEVLNENLYCAVELLQGGDLNAWIDRVHSPAAAVSQGGALGSVQLEREAGKHIVQLLRGLDYLYSLNVVHRDLKPENLMLTDEGAEAILKIIDFGLSEQLSSPDKASRIDTPAYRARVPVHYVAPELLQHVVCLGSDVWAVGVILHQMLLNTLPFNGSTDKDVLIRIATSQPRLFTDPEKMAKMSPLALDFLRRCLTKNPFLRMSVREALEHPWIHAIVSQHAGFFTRLSYKYPAGQHSPLFPSAAPQAHSDTPETRQAKQVGQPTDLNRRLLQRRRSSDPGIGKSFFPPSEDVESSGGASGRGKFSQQSDGEGVVDDTHEAKGSGDAVNDAGSIVDAVSSGSGGETEVMLMGRRVVGGLANVIDEIRDDIKLEALSLPDYVSQVDPTAEASPRSAVCVVRVDKDKQQQQQQQQRTARGALDFMADAAVLDGPGRALTELSMQSVQAGIAMLKNFKQQVQQESQTQGRSAASASSSSVGGDGKGIADAGGMFMDMSLLKRLARTPANRRLNADGTPNTDHLMGGRPSHQQTASRPLRVKALRNPPVFSKGDFRRDDSPVIDGGSGSSSDADVQWTPAFGRRSGERDTEERKNVLHRI
ncbi:unnamed protein product [Vitrella brassicaformis CCMP3155]|uniref:Protein kinase domain-containing protein n=2 Tax=Vitrella brassicaformis TaxID=1169539 RepID=A0A0G4FP24_VITBC|nr:unnamed protein product [Vitrella brassicaformis CCMP3155]|eukprot:CEM15976.1 unnamed protein product [Vitrella brassicaformis CCMP3155]